MMGNVEMQSSSSSQKTVVQSSTDNQTRPPPNCVDKRASSEAAENYSVSEVIKCTELKHEPEELDTEMEPASAAKEIYPTQLPSKEVPSQPFCFVDMEAIAPAEEFVPAELGDRLANNLVSRETVEALQNGASEEMKRPDCNYCGKSFVTEKNLSTHLTKAHPIRCPYTLCTTSFKTEREKVEHENDVHLSGEKKSFCIYCNKLFRYLQRHIQLCHKDVAIRCTYFRCCTYFKTEKERQKHVKENHKRAKKSEKLKNCTCLVCGKVYANQRTLKKHKTLCQGDVTIKCEFCKQCFKSWLDLTAHFKKKLCANYKLYLCDLCQLKATSRKSLKRHILAKHL